MRAPLIVFALLMPVLLSSAACTPAQSVKAPPLQGSTWVAEDIGGKGVVDNSRATLMFMPEGRLAGKASCNNYFGGYNLDGSKLTTSQMGSTRMACLPALMSQEDNFLRILGLVNSYEFTRDGALLLRTDKGESLRFRAEPSESRDKPK